MKLPDCPNLTWGYKAEPDGGVNGRAIAYPLGKVLGGSSSIDGTIYIPSLGRGYVEARSLGPSPTIIGENRPAIGSKVPPPGVILISRAAATPIPRTYQSPVGVTGMIRSRNN